MKTKRINDKMVKLTPRKNKMLRNVITNEEYSEVITTNKGVSNFIEV